MNTPRSSNYVYVPASPVTPVLARSTGVSVDFTSRSKSWVFVLNNWTSDQALDVELLAQGDNAVLYLVYGREVGESGTPHLQGFVKFKNKRSFNVVQALFPYGTHLEVRSKDSTDYHAATYCKKDDPHPFEFVNLS